MGGMGTRGGTGMAFVMTLLLACKLLDPASSAEPGREGLAGDFVLDFGRHKGMKLRQVPRQYLKWLQTAVTDKPLCRDAVQRFCAGTRAPGAAGEPREREVTAEIWLARWGLPPEIRRAFHNAGVRELFAWQIDCLETTGLLAGRNAVISASTR